MTRSSLVIRAVTYFTKYVDETQELRGELEYADSVLREAEKILVDRGFTVFTKRISLGNLTPSLVNHLLDYVDRDILLSVGYTRSLDPGRVVEIASQGLYVPILHGRDPDIEDAKLYSRVFHDASSIDPVVATRIAIGIHDEYFQTPYFPDSSSRGIRSIGLAFLYPKNIVSYLKSNLSIGEAFGEVFRVVDRVVGYIRGSIDLGVMADYSLSPWMENSVVEVYEAMGYPVTSTSILYATWLLNKYISEYSRRDIRIGFNEVMLPYAEDNLLIDLGRRGLIRARDFLTYASTCVAGVDMVVVSYDIEKLTGLIASAMALAWVKNRPISLRIIPTQGIEGDLVDLGKFGKIPVLAY